jgi:hypothetical protein
METEAAIVCPSIWKGAALVEDDLRDFRDVLGAGQAGQQDGEFVAAVAAHGGGLRQARSRRSPMARSRRSPWA